MAPAGPLAATPAPSVELPSVEPGYSNPVYPADVPDPFALRVGDVYYAYATNARGMNVKAVR